MKRLEVWVLLLIILGGFLVRLYKFNNPIAGWHSWRQADTSAVSRNFVKYGFDVLHPKFDDLSKTASNFDNPNGYRFVEFPIYNIVHAGLFEVFGGLGVLGLTFEQWGRLTTIFTSLLSILFLYLIVRNHSNKIIGLLAAFFYAFLPFNIFYGRTILSDPAMVAAILGGIYFFDRWMEESSSVNRHSGKRSASRISSHNGDSGQARMTNGIAYLFYFLSIIFIAGALLLKPYAIFFTLPIVYLAWKHFGFSFIKKWQLWLFLIIVILPLILWRWWIQQYPEGIPQSNWLFNGNNIRFKGAFFHWIFGDRIGRLILGYWGIGLFVLGLVGEKSQKNTMFFSSFLVSSLLYLVVMATGNVQHDYYQILIMPSIAIFLSLGTYALLTIGKSYFNTIVNYALVVICCVFMFMFSWYFVRDYFNINHPEIVEAGRAVDKIAEREAKVIAPYGGDTAFLYYTNRQGWPVFDRQIEDFIKAGATHLVFVNPSKEELNFANYYKVISKTEKYIIFDLKKSATMKSDIQK